MTAGTSKPAASGDAARNLPRDGQVMAALIRDSGITEFEPRVINQLLEFNYRYVTTILEDAKVFSNHAKKRTVDLDDVKIAVQMHVDSNMTVPPTRDVLMEAARIRNQIPLPTPKPLSGLRLPPDRFCLTTSVFRLGDRKKPSNIASQVSSPFVGSLKSSKLSSAPFSLSVKPMASGPKISVVSAGGDHNSTKIKLELEEGLTGVKRKHEEDH